jgi:predicted flap endonuclease-1-like 5' DNA nuclease
MQDYPGASAVGDRAERVMRWPLGAFSPLWAMFGAAAAGGVAYWWMTQWTRSVNIEALLGSATPLPAPKAGVTRIAIIAEPAAAEVVEAAVGRPPAAAAEVAAPPAPVAEPAPTESREVDATSDDLTRMTGIGPKLAEALAARGVMRFAQIAAWTKDDLAQFDAALSLKGRAEREAWVAQAKRLAKGA